MPKKFLCVGEPYESNGIKKVAWKRIGELFTSKAGKEYAKLYMFPGMLISVYDDKPKADTATGEGKYDQYGADTDIPF